MTSPAVDDVGADLVVARIIDRVGPLVELGNRRGIEITDVVFDDREVRPGSLFCCLVGTRLDGHDFAGEAAVKGAVAFICEHTLGPEVGDALQLVVPPGTARIAMAKAACAFYGDPAAALHSVGITGTNGKTTTTYLLRSILERAGWPSGVIGTLEGARTTPESPHLQRALAEMRDAGIVATAVEVTSHALVQHRVDGIRFDVAVFTNLSRDHLDYHETIEAYFAAKARLFTPDRARFAVVNRDDEFGRRLLDRAEIPTVSYSLDDVRELSLGLTETSFRLGKRSVHLRLGGAFNVANALAAASAARALGVEPDAIVEGLGQAAGVPGRFEALEGAGGVIAIVDYAHTPAGLEQMLAAVRADRAAADVPGKPGVIVVFGCGGDRDRGKRPVMGAIASRLADVVVLTTDNPRSEDPESIIEEIRAGMAGPAKIVVEPNRRTAIAGALRAARPGDVVVVAGKGHETTQQFADVTLRFDDREVVRAELDWIDRANRRSARRRAPGAGGVTR
ncbi:MAG: UDP-N-acetylmuramoyl-L-alanyl-D-glutamate--2,6-diaminopimelate ligase [Acidimicrobiales bacterium]